jgi:pyrroline-5-carboxylate reductase
MNQRIAFVGGGNMATSLIGGLLARGTARADIVVADPQAAQRIRLERDFGVATFADAPAAVRQAQVVVLAVKPQQMAEVSRSIATTVGQSRALVISIAAGIRLADLARWLGPDVPIVRTMPNRPALIGAGVTALYATPQVRDESRRIAEAIMAACGSTVWAQDERQIDVVTAVSGSGPAYFFLLVECLEAAGIELGLDPATARTLALETARGSGRMAAESPESPAELSARRSPPGAAPRPRRSRCSKPRACVVFLQRPSPPARDVRLNSRTSSAHSESPTTGNRHAGPALHPERTVHAARDRVPAARADASGAG